MIVVTDPRARILCLVSTGAMWLDVVSVDARR